VTKWRKETSILRSESQTIPCDGSDIYVKWNEWMDIITTGLLYQPQMISDGDCEEIG
jgi:hypothetical protein